MTVQLEKINPRFRQLTDLLCFSDRLDLDLSEFKSLLKENFNDHHEYLWDRLEKCTKIFWNNGEQFWSNRFSFLFELNERSLVKKLGEHLESRMFELVRVKERVDIQYDIEYLQFVEFCKIKHSRNESLVSVKDYLISLPSQSKFEKLTTIVRSFLPFVFENMEEYAEQLARRITHSTRNFDFLLSLEEHGIELNRQPIAQLTHELIVERLPNEKNCRALLYLIHDKGVRELLKKKYHVSCKSKLLSLLECVDFRLLEEYHFRNIKNLLELDPSLADNIIDLYARKIYDRDSGHKTANADKLIRLVKTCPQISPRRIIAFLSTNNKVPDIRYVVTAFPDLKKLAAFV
jgi:hypothetical protein